MDPKVRRRPNPRSPPKTLSNQITKRRNAVNAGKSARSYFASSFADSCGGIAKHVSHLAHSSHSHNASALVAIGLITEDDLIRQESSKESPFGLSSSY